MRVGVETDNMANGTDGFQKGAGIMLILLGVSVIVPTLFMATATPQTNTFEQEELARTTLTGDVSTEVTQVTNQGEANITLLNGRDGSYDATGILAEGESTNVTISGETIEVELRSVIDVENVLVTYTYPLYIGWPSGAETVFKNLPDILIMATTVMVIGAIYTGFQVMVQ